jgi:putative ABC transport system ATP-binding protein
MGPSGSGKSTLLHVLAGLQTPDDGRVWIDGVDVHALDEERATRFRRRRIGLVFQLFNLVPTLDVEHNVALPLLAAGERLRAVRPGLEDLLERLGVAETLRRRPAELSGGQQQRVAIARALLPAPAVLLADEPTGSLDSAAGEQVLRLLRGLARGRSVAVVTMTHDPRAASYADRLVLLRDGRIESDRAVPDAERAA